MSLLEKFMIRYKTPQEIEIMRQAAQIVSRTLGLVAQHMKPGVTPRFLDQLAEDYIRSQNAIPGFKNGKDIGIVNRESISRIFIISLIFSSIQSVLWLFFIASLTTLL